MRRPRTAPFLFLLFLTAPPLRACNVPVFRYALERWRPAPYEVFLFHRGPLTARERRAAALLDKQDAEAGLANLIVTPIDLDREPDAAARKLFAAQEKPVLPWMVVRGRDVDGKKVTTWSGKVSPESVALLLDSPLRRELVKRILAGETAVWLLLESGDRAKDDAVARRLESELRRLTPTLKLPGLTESPEDRVSEKGPPLRIAFSVLRLRRDDPAERLLVPMFLRSEDDLAERNEPMAFPVFGRGRCLAALVGAGLTAKNLKASCKLLLAPCTCDVQDDMEWFELLVSADWQDILDAGQSDTSPTRQRGTRPPALARRACVRPVRVEERRASPVVAATRGTEESRPLLPRWLLLSGIGVAGLLVVLTGVWAMRSGRNAGGNP